MKVPNVTQIVLLLIEINDKKFYGKTNIHKNLYLLKEMIKDVDLPYQFRPYFYGPYSEQIAESLDILESSGFLLSSEIVLGRDDVFEIRQKNYDLSSSGMNAVKRIENSFPEFVEAFTLKFNNIKETGFHQNTRILSTAAKVKFILSIEKKALTSKNIKEKAKELGWEIDQKDINSAVKVLVQTNLAKSN